MLRFSEANAKTGNLVKIAELAKYLTGNRKVYSLDLPSGVSCPGAHDCHSFAKVDPQTGKAHIVDGPHCQFRCFSASQEVQYPALRALRAGNKKAIDGCGKSSAKIAKLILASLPSDAGIIRLHVGGDFYSLQYMAAIVMVAALREDILFYFYTKSLHHLKEVVKDMPQTRLYEGVILPNLLVTASVGGNYDHLIADLQVRTAIVVYSESEAEHGLYTPRLEIDHDDSHAATVGESFALLLHGTQPGGTPAAKALSVLRKTGKGSYSRKGV